MTQFGDTVAAPDEYAEERQRHPRHKQAEFCRTEYALALCRQLIVVLAAAIDIVNNETEKHQE